MKLLNVRLIYGGSWVNNPADVPTSYRYNFFIPAYRGDGWPQGRDYAVGFRLSLS